MKKIISVLAIHLQDIRNMDLHRKIIRLIFYFFPKILVQNIEYQPQLFCHMLEFSFTSKACNSTVIERCLVRESVIRKGRQLYMFNKYFLLLLVKLMGRASIYDFCNIIYYSKSAGVKQSSSESNDIKYCVLI